jgi:hypothetical protein
MRSNNNNNNNNLIRTLHKWFRTCQLNIGMKYNKICMIDKTEE